LVDKHIVRGKIQSICEINWNSEFKDGFYKEPSLFFIPRTIIKGGFMKRIFTVIVLAAFLGGCASAARHSELTRNNADKLTVGKVQKEIRIGMPSSQVIEALGSPNVVTTDEERREVWVYDKIATDVSYSSSESGAGVWLLIVGVGGSGRSGAQSTSQRTLTIVIKFGKDQKVRDFAYHSSSF
jgi:outer membrane protein assembly factor BamE (lipoprotein component of BamABCDE complex)